MAQLPALNEPLTDDGQVIVLDESTSLPWLLRSQDDFQEMIHDTQFSVLALFEKWRLGQAEWDDIEKRMGSEIETLFDRLIFDSRSKTSAHSHMLLMMTNQVREEFSRLETRFNIQFNGNCIYALSHYLLHRAGDTPQRLTAERTKIINYSYCR